MGGGREVEVINSKGCSRLLVNSISPSVRLIGISHDSASVSSFSTHPNAPFTDLVICVTGLSKDARKQVMDATRRLGGEYSPDLHPKCTHLVVQISEAATLQGAKPVNHWIGGGRNASHVVCEGTSVGKYIGHSDILVTPLWVLKTAKEKCVQRLVHVSFDLARQLGTILENVQSGLAVEERNKDTCSSDALKSGIKVSHEVRQNMANLAKSGVRKRRVLRMQRCQTPIRPITPRRLLDSVCWSVSEPTCTAAIYTESSGFVDAGQNHASIFYDPNADEKESFASFVNFSRKLTERLLYVSIGFQLYPLILQNPSYIK